MAGDSKEMVADIIVAECFGQGWLVRGEQHIDDLLGNMVPPDVSIEVIACESKLDVDALWERWNEEEGAEMWMIHPAIVKRIQGSPAKTTIMFPPWSAALDKDAQQVIELAVKVLAERPEGVVALIRHVTAEGGRTAEDLGGLRCTLIEGRLAEAGVAAGRMVRDTTPAAKPADAERIDVLVR